VARQPALSFSADVRDLIPEICPVRSRKLCPISNGLFQPAILLCEMEKVRQTVTAKKSQLKTETTQVMINSNPLSYFANLPFKANPKNRKGEKKIQPKESPTLLVVRLTRYRRSSSCHSLAQIFLPSIHSPNRSSVVLCCPCRSRRGEKRERSEKS